MPQNLDKDGLRSKINSYELFFIDIWGVIHNGLQIFEDSIEVLENLKKNNKEFVLLTNAPRPNSTVNEFLKKMGLKKFYENVYTSGEASLKYLINEVTNSFKIFWSSFDSGFWLFEFINNELSFINSFCKYDFIWSGVGKNLYVEVLLRLDISEILAIVISATSPCSNINFAVDMILSTLSLLLFCFAIIKK